MKVRNMHMIQITIMMSTDNQLSMPQLKRDMKIRSMMRLTTTNQAKHIKMTITMRLNKTDRLNWNHRQSQKKPNLSKQSLNSRRNKNHRNNLKQLRNWKNGRFITTMKFLIFLFVVDVIFALQILSFSFNIVPNLAQSNKLSAEVC